MKIIFHIVLALVVFILIGFAWDTYLRYTHTWAIKIILYREAPEEDNTLDSIRFIQS